LQLATLDHNQGLSFANALEFSLVLHSLIDLSFINRNL
jgi:hypothetical protein